MRIGDPEHNRRVYGDKYDADSEAAIRKALCNPTGSYVEATRALDALVERERLLREALRERDYALRRIATTGDEVSNPAEWMRGIARSALDAAGEQA